MAQSARDLAGGGAVARCAGRFAPRIAGRRIPGAGTAARGHGTGRASRPRTRSRGGPQVAPPAIPPGGSIGRHFLTRTGPARTAGGVRLVGSVFGFRLLRRGGPLQTSPGDVPAGRGTDGVPYRRDRSRRRPRTQI